MDESQAPEVATDSAPDEVAQPAPDEVPAASPTSRTAARVGVALVVVTVAGVVGFFGYSALSERLEARADLERALDLVKGADATVLAVDDVVRAEITRGLAEQAEETSAQVPAARTDIDEALALLDSAYESLDAEDREIAEALRDAADARLDMLDEAPAILGANIAASRALGPAEEAIEALVEAETLTSQAADKFNLQTKEGVTASTELSNRALEMLEEASTGFVLAMDVFPEADMSPFLVYIRAKKELVEKSTRIDELWLANKIAEANELVDEYNDQDAEVAALGDDLPDSETAPIAEAYEALTARATVRYYDARDRAAVADTLLRQLLGTESDGEGLGETTATPSTVATGTSPEEGTPTDGR